MTDRGPLRGNLVAIEFLLGQIFVQLIDRVDDPQGWLLENANQIEAKIRRPSSLNQEEQDAAYDTVRRVMETASTHFEAMGRGPKIG